MQIIQSHEEAKNFGTNIVDVRIKRADLPPANSEAIYKRMQTEREREAKESYIKEQRLHKKSDRQQIKMLHNFSSS